MMFKKGDRDEIIILWSFFSTRLMYERKPTKGTQKKTSIQFKRKI
jgi:hypothetical protein